MWWADPDTIQAKLFHVLKILRLMSFDKGSHVNNMTIQYKSIRSSQLNKPQFYSLGRNSGALIPFLHIVYHVLFDMVNNIFIFHTVPEH